MTLAGGKRGRSGVELVGGRARVELRTNGIIALQSSAGWLQRSCGAKVCDVWWRLWCESGGGWRDTRGSSPARNLSKSSMVFVDRASISLSACVVIASMDVFCAEFATDSRVPRMWEEVFCARLRGLICEETVLTSSRSGGFGWKGEIPSSDPLDGVLGKATSVASVSHGIVRGGGGGGRAGSVDPPPLLPPRDEPPSPFSTTRASTPSCGRREGIAD